MRTIIRHGNLACYTEHVSASCKVEGNAGAHEDVTHSVLDTGE